MALFFARFLPPIVLLSAGYKEASISGVEVQYFFNYTHKTAQFLTLPTHTSNYANSVCEIVTKWYGSGMDVGLTGLIMLPRARNDDSNVKRRKNKRCSFDMDNDGHNRKSLAQRIVLVGARYGPRTVADLVMGLASGPKRV